VWREQRFELGKYMKGPEDRGWVLRSTEDILVLLEDMGLNLQSMMASPFVRPFLTEVGYTCSQTHYGWLRGAIPTWAYSPCLVQKLSSCGSCSSS
jgi:hypothetical protein